MSESEKAGEQAQGRQERMGTETGRPRILAFAGAKGGTGKSLMAANVAVFLSTLGRKVALVDTAFGGATLHAFVGLRDPARTLADFFARKDIGLDEVLLPTVISGLQIITGESDPAWAANPRPNQFARLREQLPTLDVDYIVLDLSPGTRETTLDLFLDADLGAVVTTCEPTAVQMSHRFVKSAFIRQLRRNSLGDLCKISVEESREYEGGIPGPQDLLERCLARFDEGSAETAALQAEMNAFVPSLVINMARSKADIGLGKDIASAAGRRFGIHYPFLGAVEYDDAAWVSLRRGRPLLVEHPESRASKCIEKITRKVMSRREKPEILPSLAACTAYELLDVEPTASDEAIRRANRRAQQLFAADSVVVGGLYRGDRFRKLERALQDAYETLMDPEKRRAYDQQLFPDGIPASALGVSPVEETGPLKDRPTPPPVDEETVFDGALLRTFRESKGLDLRQISERTKIGTTYLRAIEEDCFASLPASVYVRGFVSEYARMLGLQVEQVVNTYMQRMQQQQQSAQDI